MMQQNCGDFYEYFPLPRNVGAEVWYNFNGISMYLFVSLDS